MGGPRLKISCVWANKRNSNKSFKKVPLSLARSLDRIKLILSKEIFCKVREIHVNE